ncbi:MULTISPECIES: hypothetical protein [unclassified Microcoleus]|uniref:hypothetical protein n=1 Tax=unclassified Microcoleus TaxID=2642155 RepID=UPI002FD41163
MAVEIAKEQLFILVPEWEHLTQLMQTVIAQPAVTAQTQLTDPRFVAKNFTWKHAFDQLLNVILPGETSYKIDQ